MFPALRYENREKIYWSVVQCVQTWLTRSTISNMLSFYVKVTAENVSHYSVIDETATAFGDLKTSKIYFL